MPWRNTTKSLGLHCVDRGFNTTECWKFAPTPDICPGGYLPHGYRGHMVDVFMTSSSQHDPKYYPSPNPNKGGSVAEWLACWTRAQKGPGSNRSRDAVG